MPLNYIDIGCSGGPKRSDIIDGRNCYVGIDPLTNEIQRLTKKYKGFKNTEFIAGFVGLPTNEFPANSNYHLELLAPFYAAEVMMRKTDVSCFEDVIKKLRELKSRRISSPKDISNTSFDNYWQNVFSMGRSDYAEKIISFEEIEKRLDNPNPCILKIDTDGCECLILRDWDTSRLNERTFGVDIELQMHGDCSKRSSTFSNVDIFLRKRGFVLTSMELVKYSTAALPGAFKHQIPADSISGTPQWANCSYTRLLPVIDQSCDHVTATHILSVAKFFGLKGWIAEIVCVMYQLGFISTDQAMNKLNEISFEEIGIDWMSLHRSFVANPLNCSYQKRLRRRDAISRIRIGLNDLIHSFRN